MEYKVLFCPKCHKPQMTAAKERLKCISCGKSSKFEGNYMFTSKDPATASWAVRKLAEYSQTSKDFQKIFKALKELETQRVQLKG